MLRPCASGSLSGARVVSAAIVATACAGVAATSASVSVASPAITPRGVRPASAPIRGITVDHPRTAAARVRIFRAGESMIDVERCRVAWRRPTDRAARLRARPDVEDDGAMTLAAPRDGPPSPQDADGTAPAVVVVEGSGMAPSELLRRVGLRSGAPHPVIVVCGGADDLQGDALAAAGSVLGPAVRAAVARTGAAVVDGGTDAGVMKLVGAERARDPRSMPVLLGVAPAGKVSHRGATGGDRTRLAHAHTHFVLADSDEWSGETALLAALAHELAVGAPVVMVLAGGGEGARGEVREAVARHWPVFAIAGTGGLADEIAPPPPKDPVERALRAVEERVRTPPATGEFASGDIRRASADDVAGLARRIAWELQAEPILKRAWRSFATYDALAKRSRKTFELLQRWTLALGVVGTVVALTHSEVGSGDLKDVLHWGAVVTPIVVATMIAIANRGSAGKRWILLRAAAEGVKSEIYRYRTRTGLYSAESQSRAAQPMTREARLAARLNDLDAGLIQTAASGGALTPYKGELPPPMYGAEAADDGLSRLDVKGYMAIRIADQLSYYRGRVDGSPASARGCSSRRSPPAGSGPCSPPPAPRSGWVRPPRWPVPSSRTSATCRSTTRSSRTTRPRRRWTPCRTTWRPRARTPRTCRRSSTAARRC